MNSKLVFGVIGRLLEILAAILLLPMLVSVIYRENTFISFLVTALISLVTGIVLHILCRKHDRTIYAKEGFLIVALSWLVSSFIGSLPFFLSGEVPSYIDALFESVSGFTTTGASVIPDVEALSHGILFWRSFTHWIGGMGVLVFIIAFATNFTERSIHILRAEMAGPVVGKLMPRAKDTTKILYIIYIVMTVVQIIMLWAGGMNFFESVVHSLGTAGTGGFGTKSDSIAGYSPYIQWVIGVFMLLFGVNFNLYYLICTKHGKFALKSTELWVYICMIIIATSAIAINISPMYSSLSETIRTSFFNVTSITTTTGYSTADFNLWPTFSKGIIFVLMFIGGCAGSTAGGLKVSRVVILFKMIAREVRHLIHPRSISTVRFEGKEVEEHTQRNIANYFAVYMMFLVGLLFIVSLEPFDFETAVSVTVTCFNNVGPGFSFAGPMASYSEFSNLSKIVLSLAMLMGRLEIFPIVIFMFPSSWNRKK
ncbi:MAG: TrkH family potassium uptake protein [Clostridia bacterium]|nr:TrkH family potassium uptake protein [Clostridia bacterium]